MTAWVVRPFQTSDARQIGELFSRTIRTVNLRDYSPEQVDAWAGDGVGAEMHWAAKLSRRATFVAVDGETVIGFADLEPDGHLDHLFVHHLYQRQGVATALHEAIEAEARRIGATRLYTEASLTARPFFLRSSYTVVREQTVTIRGVGLTNFVMEKALGWATVVPAIE